MTPKYALEVVDRLFRNLCKSDKIFGNKIVIASGDFRQTLPVVKYSKRTKIIEDCVKSSKLWKYFKHLTLKDNLRVNQNELAFKEWLLNIGDGIYSSNFENYNEAIEIPNEILCTNNNIISEIYAEIIDLKI